MSHGVTVKLNCSFSWKMTQVRKCKLFYMEYRPSGEDMCWHIEMCSSSKDGGLDMAGHEMILQKTWHDFHKNSDSDTFISWIWHILTHLSCVILWCWFIHLESFNEYSSTYSLYPWFAFIDFAKDDQSLRVYPDTESWHTSILDSRSQI